MDDKNLRDEVESIQQFDDAALRLPVLKDLAELPVSKTALLPGFDSDGRPIEIPSFVWVADFTDIKEKFL